jgi:hypothetical protein
MLALLMIGGGIYGAIWWRNEKIRRWKWAAIVIPERLARVPRSMGRYGARRSTQRNR